MESLIKTINKLQDVFSVIGEHKIDLPQIVVVGSQSSGKSSVLESLVGSSFLPRGVGIVTRAPLVLQMIKYSAQDKAEMFEKTKNPKIKEWACFLHKPDTIYYKFEEVRKEIEHRTDVLAGKNKGVTHEQIVLKVYTNLYDLTFIDLPGITKVPVGDQPEDIDQQIQELILSYVKQPNSIILAVVTANTDPSTSESLQIARKMDPEGLRTIAVVTKLDIIDKGTLKETTEFLCGRKIPVKLGIIGVVNRSQKDINDHKCMKETLKSEQEFLRLNYPEICKYHGNKVLASTLQKILIMHIKKTVPILQKNLQETKNRLEFQLKTMKTPDNNLSFILGFLKDIYKSYCDTVNGNRKDIPDDIILGGSKIFKVINEQFVTKLDSIDPLLDLSDEQIGNILLNTAGTQNSPFINEKALEFMVNKQLHNLIEPSLNIVDLVCTEMLQIFDYIDSKVLETLKRYPKLNSDVRTVLNKLLNDTVINLKEFINSYIETQQTCLNTTNPDFILEYAKSDNKNLKVSLLSKDNSSFVQKLLNGVLDFEEVEINQQVKVHKNLTSCYFTFIKKNIRDIVPKRIKHKMINFVLQEFEHYLHEDVFAVYVINKSYDDVLVEEDGIVEDRQSTQNMLEAVNKALLNIIDIQCY